MSGRSLVIVAYYFPPDGGAGAQRPLKFAKYLSQAGWRVTIVTHPGEAEQSWTRPEDRSLRDELESDFSGQVIRVPIPDSKPQGGAIDEMEGWSVSTAEVVKELIQRGGVDAVIYTMSPFSLVRSADLVRRSCPGVPVILDFRDPWALDGWQAQPTKWHWNRQFRLMKSAIEAADGVIANTPECGRLFRESFPGLDGDRLAVITNGYDAADFQGNPGAPSLWDPDDWDVLRLVFSGSLCTRVLKFYSGLRGRVKRVIGYAPERIDYSGRTLIHLMDAVKCLREKGEPLADQIRIEVMGVEDAADRESVERAGMIDLVRFHGYVPHDESVRHIRLADALLLPLHGLPPGKRSRIVPGKTYEYLATGRPILGLLPQGDAREFVESSGRAAIADPCDPESIAVGLRRIPDLVKRFSLGFGPDPSVQRFERARLSGELEKFVLSICEGSS